MITITHEDRQRFTMADAFAEEAGRRTADRAMRAGVATALCRHAPTFSTPITNRTLASLLGALPSGCRARLDPRPWGRTYLVVGWAHGPMGLTVAIVASPRGAATRLRRWRRQRGM